MTIRAIKLTQTKEIQYGHQWPVKRQHFKSFPDYGLSQLSNWCHIEILANQFTHPNSRQVLFSKWNSRSLSLLLVCDMLNRERVFSCLSSINFFWCDHHRRRYYHDHNRTPTAEQSQIWIDPKNLHSHTNSIQLKRSTWMTLIYRLS